MDADCKSIGVHRCESAVNRQYVVSIVEPVRGECPPPAILLAGLPSEG